MRQSITSLPVAQQQLLDGIQIRLLAQDELPRAQQLLDEHHYLGGPQARRQASPLRRHRRPRRLARRAGLLRRRPPPAPARPRDWLVRRATPPPAPAHRQQYPLPAPAPQDRPQPRLQNPGLVLARLADDWQTRYGHPVLLVKTFVDPEHFAGTLYTASGWTELGPPRPRLLRAP